MMRGPILYVEDEEDFQMLVQRILGKEGFDVHVVGTGEEGLAALERIKPSLLILDINLPDTDGYALCKRLRQTAAWSHLPILMLTVRRRPEEWLKGFACGADDYVAKPLNPPELVERVRSCVEGRRSTGEESGNAEYLLIQAAVAGNQNAFEILIQKYRTRLIESLRAMGKTSGDAEDIASAVFVRAFKKLRQFRGGSTFYTWLYRITMNELSHQRRAGVHISLEGLTAGDETILPAQLAEPDRVGEDMSQKVLHAQIHQAVSVIPRPYRQMLKWHFVRGLSYQTMARRLKIPRGTVMSRLFKAKQLLRRSWDRGRIDESS